METKLQMKRKLVDALIAQIDSCLILPEEEMGIYEIESHFVYGSTREKVKTMRAKVVQSLGTFYRLATEFNLPVHNAVAFFSRFLALEQSYNSMNNNDRIKLRELLHFALSGRGFVFGTAFDMERNSYLRPCDLKRSDELVEAAIINQALLKGSLYFLTDYSFSEEDIQELSRQVQVVEHWRDEIKGCMNDQVEVPPLTEDALNNFLNIFEEYSIQQLKVLKEDDSDIAKVKSYLQQIKEAALILYSLDRFICELESLLKIDDDNERLTTKQKWLERFFEFLREEHTESALKIARELDQNNATNELLGLNEFIRVAKSAKVVGDKIKKYPILHPTSCPKSLTSDEIDVLTNYRKHPMYGSYRAIIISLSIRKYADIAPYFLTEWFIHRLNPKKPFMKRQHTIKAVDGVINGTVNIEKDKRVHHYQNCNYKFFCDLCGWYARFTNKSYNNEELCHVLYARCRHQVMKRDWLLVESRSLNERRSSEEPLFHFFRRLDGVFDYEAFPFPLYSKTLNQAEHILYHFYDRQDEKLRRVQKKIKNLITVEDVERYRDLVFLSDNGFGNSFMPLAWHKDLASWLEGIIRRDEDIIKYAVGDTDPFYPGSAVRLSEIKEAITFYEEIDNIYPEDLQPYLAFVQWYIQKVCCERIRDNMLETVPGLYKRIFLGSSPQQPDETDSSGGNP